MKSLISVTPQEFKRHFSEVMDMVTDIVMSTDQEIVITVPSENCHIEIAKVTPVANGVTYDYNYRLLKAHGISTDGRVNRIESAIAEAFEKSGFTECIDGNDKVAVKLQAMMTAAAKELAKQFKDGLL